MISNSWLGKRCADLMQEPAFWLYVGLWELEHDMQGIVGAAVRCSL